MWNFTSVRLRVRVFAVLLAALILLPFATGGAAAGTTITVTGTYHQSDARSMLEMINSFRQSDDAWYDLSGRKLATKPTKKSVYIHHGKKFVFK